MSKDPSSPFDHNQLTFRMLYALRRTTLPLSHDEVVHGKGSLLSKMPATMAEVRQHAAAARLYVRDAGQKLTFMGIEFGQWSEWNTSRPRLAPSSTRRCTTGLSRWTGDLNRVIREERPLHELDFDPAGFAWIDASDSSRGHQLPAPSTKTSCYRGVNSRRCLVQLPDRCAPAAGLELLNSDAPIYGGSGQGNLGRGRRRTGRAPTAPAQPTLTLPPLGAVS